MENLQNLMQCLDDISKMIPEGTYLEMCDNLKQVHKNLPKRTEPRVPFMPVQPNEVVESDTDSEFDSDEEDETWNPEWYDEWTQNEECLRRLLADLKVAKQTLKKLKPIQRITKRIKVDALKAYCRQANFYPDEMDEWTFERFAEIAASHDWPESSRDKRFERSIYENYRILENRLMERKKNDMLELKRNLEIEINDVRERQNYMRVHYNL